jgi:uncharacterized protein (DUF4415 family)
MKQPTRVTRGGKIANLKASGYETGRWHDLMVEIGGLQKPAKKLVRLELDADLLAWFKKPGRGYQTRINRALRKVMMEERKEIRT